MSSSRSSKGRGKGSWSVFPAPDDPVVPTADVDAFRTALTTLATKNFSLEDVLFGEEVVLGTSDVVAVFEETGSVDSPGTVYAKCVRSGCSHPPDVGSGTKCKGTYRTKCKGTNRTLCAGCLKKCGVQNPVLCDECIDEQLIGTMSWRVEPKALPDLVVGSCSASGNTARDRARIVIEFQFPNIRPEQYALFKKVYLPLSLEGSLLLEALKLAFEGRKLFEMVGRCCVRKNLRWDGLPHIVVGWEWKMICVVAD